MCLFFTQCKQLIFFCFKVPLVEFFSYVFNGADEDVSGER
jgi:hypothetical protein